MLRCVGKYYVEFCWIFFYRFPVLKEFGRSRIDKVTVIGLGGPFFWNMVCFAVNFSCFACLLEL